MLEIQTPKYRRLLRLRHLLNYELSTSALFILWFLGTFIILPMAVSAIVFTTYMLRVLFSEKRVGWIIFFFILIIIPLAVTIFFLSNYSYQVYLFYIILIFFYFYCFVLKFVVPDWIEERGRIDRNYPLIEKIEL
jgi:hypothetical protein